MTIEEQTKIITDAIHRIMSIVPTSMASEIAAIVIIKAAVEAGIPSYDLRDTIYRLYGDELNSD